MQSGTRSSEYWEGTDYVDGLPFNRRVYGPGFPPLHSPYQPVQAYHISGRHSPGHYDHRPHPHSPRGSPMRHMSPHRSPPRSPPPHVRPHHMWGVDNHVHEYNAGHPFAPNWTAIDTRLAAQFDHHSPMHGRHSPVHGPFGGPPPMFGGFGGGGRYGPPSPLKMCPPRPRSGPPPVGTYPSEGGKRRKGKPSIGKFHELEDDGDSSSVATYDEHPTSRNNQGFPMGPERPGTPPLPNLQMPPRSVPRAHTDRASETDRDRDRDRPPMRTGFFPNSASPRHHPPPPLNPYSRDEEFGNDVRYQSPFDKKQAFSFKYQPGPMYERRMPSQTGGPPGPPGPPNPYAPGHDYGRSDPPSKPPKKSDVGPSASARRSSK